MAEGKPEDEEYEERLCMSCADSSTIRSADVFCSTCQQFQCMECSNCHKMVPLMKNHNLIPVSEGQTQQSTKVCDVDMKGTDICKEHNKAFEFFCEKDKVLVCSSCVILKHRMCNNVMDISMSGMDDQCKALGEKIQNAIMRSNYAIGNVNRSVSRLSRDVQQIPGQLKDMKKQMNVCFDDFAKEVTKISMEDVATITAEWMEKKNECENNIKTMSSTLKLINDISAKGTKSQQFIGYCSMRGAVQKAIMSVDSLCAELDTLNVSCNYDKQCEMFQTLLTNNLTAESIMMKYNVAKATRLELMCSKDLPRAEYDAREPLYSGLDFLPDGRLIVVDNENCKCLVYDGMELKSTFTSGYKYPPYESPVCVVAVSNDEVVITMGSILRLDFLTVNKSDEITLKRRCAVNVLYSFISMMDDGHFIVCAADHKPPVRIVSISGNEKDLDIKLPSKKYSVGTCVCTYIRGQDKVVFTDRYKDAVYIYNIETGKNIVVKDERIKSPYGVAVGPGDHIFVASSDNRSLVEITPNGHVLSSHQLKMTNPCYLAVSKDREIIAVSNSTNGHRKLSLYKLVFE